MNGWYIYYMDGRCQMVLDKDIAAVFVTCKDKIRTIERV